MAEIKLRFTEQSFMNAFERQRRSRRPSAPIAWRAPVMHNPFEGLSQQFWLLSGFLVVVFLTGGGARGDVESLIVLRPLAVILVGFAAAGLNGRILATYRWLFCIGCACLLIPLIQLVPLPTKVFLALGGREMVANIDQSVGILAMWRPLTLAPALTWNSAWAVFPPLAVLMLGVQISGSERKKTLVLVLLLGSASAALEFAQSLGDQFGTLRLYDVSSPGVPVGLFSNRNHQAVFLASLIPMLAVWSQSGKTSRDAARGGTSSVWALVAALCSLCLMLLILLTGSRTGLLLGVAACLSVPLVIGWHPKVWKRDKDIPAKKSERKPLNRIGIITALAIGLMFVFISIYVGRAESINRLLDSNPTDDLRIKILPTVYELIQKYWLWGSGAGTFKPVYRTQEIQDLLAPAMMDHVNNDWLETVMTDGLMGVGVILASITFWLVHARTAFFSPKSLPPKSLPPKSRGALRCARLGSIIILLFALASVTDYPIRTPIVACIMTLAALWMVDDNDADVIISKSIINTAARAN